MVTRSRRPSPLMSPSSSRAPVPPALVSTLVMSCGSSEAAGEGAAEAEAGVAVTVRPALASTTASPMWRGFMAVLLARRRCGG